LAWADRAGEAALQPEQRQMVVLQHDAVKEPEAVVPAPAAGDGVLLQHSITRGGLAGVEQAGAAPAKRVDQLVGVGGDTREMLEKVEDDPFGGEQDAGVAADGREHAARSDRAAITGAEAAPWRPP
jgi:hypothetical protein